MAVDDSSRLDSTVDSLCCAAENLRSTWEFMGTSLAAGVRVHLTSVKAAFVDPFPAGNLYEGPGPNENAIRLPEAYVNCPMEAWAVHVFSASQPHLWILPDGCSMGLVDGVTPVLPPTLSEGCPSATHCDMCYPNFPNGMQVLGQAPSVWASTNFTSSNHSYRTADLRPYYIIVADFERELVSGGTKLTVFVRANAMPPPGSHIIVTGVQSQSTNVSTATNVMCSLEIGGLSPAPPLQPALLLDTTLTVLVSWPHDAGVADVDVGAEMQIECHLQGRVVSMAANATVAFTTPETVRSEGQFPDVTTQPAGFQHGVNSTTAMYGAGPGSTGLGVSRLVRWTPTRGQEGSDYKMCFSAVVFSNTTAGGSAIQVADRRCYVVHVARCRYCTLAGDTLESIALAVHTHWYQLWAANSQLGPRVAPTGLEIGTLLTLGVQHILPKDMRLVDVALQFATTEAALRELNPDLPSDEDWVGEGRHLCVVPGVCDSSVNLDGTGRKI